MQKFSYALSDGFAVAKRNVIKIKRVPKVLVSVLISPIIFVLLFAYVFGSSIDIPGSSYREFLISGIFAMTLVFGATLTGAGLADDMQRRESWTGSDHCPCLDRQWFSEGRQAM